MVASGTRTADFKPGWSAGSSASAAAGVISCAGIPQARHPSRKSGRKAMSSSSSATNSPSFCSKASGAIFLRIRFSSMHSTAAVGSLTAYRAPLCSNPWCRPVVPERSSPFSKRVTRNPRRVRSCASAPPVPPPPTITICSSMISGNPSLTDVRNDDRSAPLKN